MAAGPRTERSERNDEHIREDASGASKRADKRERQIVLVLQGGGALGAYQAGVYQALHERGIEPDWIIGTSIGAINASLIAGNRRRDRLERLQGVLEAAWRNRPPFGVPAWTGIPDTMAYWKTLLRGIPASSSPTRRVPRHACAARRRRAPATTRPRRWRRRCSSWSTSRCINNGKPRLTVGAAHVRTSEMRYFDSRDMPIDVKHIMASGALPPAFPAVRIDGELYWDGGILSNTPTEAIFDDNPRKNSLIFAVHLWNPMGAEPSTIWEVLNRQKDIQYSSRVASHIARQQQMHRLRHVINELGEAAAGGRAQQPEARELAAYGCPTRMHVVRLLAPRLDNENHTKDVDFSPGSIRKRWEAGYAEDHAGARAGALAGRVRSARRRHPARARSPEYAAAAEISHVADPTSAIALPHARPVRCTRAAPDAHHRPDRVSHRGRPVRDPGDPAVAGAGL